MITKKEAWIEFAIAFRLAKKNRTEEQKELTRSGICHSVFALEFHYKLISLSTHDSMLDEICFDCISANRIFLFPRMHDEPDLPRAEYCEQKAKECEQR